MPLREYICSNEYSYLLLKILAVLGCVALILFLGVLGMQLSLRKDLNE